MKPFQSKKQIGTTKSFADRIGGIRPFCFDLNEEDSAKRIEKEAARARAKTTVVDGERVK